MQLNCLFCTTETFFVLITKSSITCHWQLLYKWPARNPDTYSNEMWSEWGIVQHRASIINRWV